MSKIFKDLDIQILAIDALKPNEIVETNLTVETTAAPV